jgi:hypothetical protein
LINKKFTFYITGIKLFGKEEEKKQKKMTKSENRECTESCTARKLPYLQEIFAENPTI